MGFSVILNDFFFFERSGFNSSNSLRVFRPAKIAPAVWCEFGMLPRANKRGAVGFFFSFFLFFSYKFYEFQIYVCGVYTLFFFILLKTDEE